MTRSAVMTAAEAARRLRVQHITIQRWVKDGRLTPIRRKPLLFDEAEVERRAAQMDQGLKTKAQIARAEAAS
jgi:excisionase family DNA binding protein